MAYFPFLPGFMGRLTMYYNKASEKNKKKGGKKLKSIRYFSDKLNTSLEWLSKALLLLLWGLGLNPPGPLFFDHTT